VVEHLLDRLDRLLLGRDRDLGRVIHELPGQLEHAEGQGRREEERLAPLGRRQPAQEEPEVRDEAHVEHPVGLVDHEHLDAPRRPDVLLQVVDQPPGGADEHVAALPEVVALLRVVDAAVDGQDPEPRELAEKAGVGLDLHDELAGRRDDEHSRRRRRRRRRPARPQDARVRGDQKGGRLARPRLGLARHVLAPEGERKGGLLDRSGGDEARLADAPHDGVGQVEGEEVHAYLARQRPLAVRAIDPAAFPGPPGRHRADPAPRRVPDERSAAPLSIGS